MPRAPSSQPQVAPSPLPSARLTAVASPDVYGAGAADAITRAAANIYERYSLEADQVAFMEADTKAAKAQTDIQLQVRDLQGKDAAGAPDVARQKWEQAMGEIQPTLTGPRQQRAFARVAAGRWEELYKTTQFHVAEQTTKYADQSSVTVAEEDDVSGWRVELAAADVAGFRKHVADILLVCHYIVR